jgi:hypothetical protein
MQDTVPAPPETITTRVARALDELGHSADDVADRLRALDVKGRRNLPYCCPVANLLLGIDQVAAVEVLETFAEVFVINGTEPLVVPVPDAVSAFITAFDDGVHLDLVDHAEVTA